MLQVEADSRIPSGTVIFIPRRKFETRITPDGLALHLEPEQEWLKRGAVIYNVGVPIKKQGDSDAQG